MIRRSVLALALALGAAPLAAAPADIAEAVIDRHVLPGFARFEAAAADLQAAAEADCDPGSDPLRAAWGAAFDAWLGVSHLRLGPTETDNRAFALAFWPDPRGMTPKALAGLIADADPVVESQAGFATVSVAARGFYALEYLLYDPQFTPPTPYGCALIRAETRDIHALAAAILADWQDGYADLMRQPGPEAPYKDEREVLKAFFTALHEGLQVDVDLRLGRPLGTFERPRPTRAESWRSGRSLHNVTVTLTALRDLAMLMAAEDPASAAALSADFDRADRIAADLDDPVFAGVATPQGRLRVEILQQAIHEIAEETRASLGPALGVAAGFNSRDGD
ncbi:imelysin family protein [Rhodovulum visakhapatnamense]|uniref:Imelysin family protein n=1 Tax=Rhodovulum visakhapatnamense TaxID=364297 RepID=A0ABS1RGN3_9RHOB|nr:imelysin family protein [Rhodovulum visakhapatnamense]MBL3570043.1 imelysin family protein [Rhodovulum visakhapatnamense]MBL3578309.1 imelysin family protein [Rhodovulum visakhapatnamense]